MRIRYMTPLYDFDKNISHIAVPRTARTTLLEMGNQLPNTDDLVAVYIPEGADNAWDSRDKRGRVVGAIRLLPMPRDRRIEDYTYSHWDDSNPRWPIGWPCQAVFAPSVDQCRYLRWLVEDIHGEGTFQPYVSRMHLRPIPVESRMSERILAFLEEEP